MPKDRGAEQGNGDGPLECSLAWRRSQLRRDCVAEQQAASALP